MQRLGIVNCFQNHLLHRVWAVFLVVAFFLSVDSWGACQSSSYVGWVQATSYGAACSNGSFSSCSGSPLPEKAFANGGVYGSAVCAGFTNRYTQSIVTIPCNNCCAGSQQFTQSDISSMRVVYRVFCSTEDELDSLNCVNKGWMWDSQNRICNDPSICGDYRSQCEEVGGIFHGVVFNDGGGSCCRATCNVCGGESFKKMYDMKKQICCDRMQAPPAEEHVCFTDQSPSVCGMVWSQYQELTSAEWACRDPSLDVDAAIRYRTMCFETSSSSTEDSSNSGDSSSGAGGGDDSSGSGTQYPEGCEECPWLDSILDTLTLQKQTVDAIYNCIIYPGLCSDNSSNNDTPTPSDSNILAVLPYLDTSNLLNEQQIEAIKSLDTLLERLNFKDSIALMNDTLTWTALYTIASSIQGHIDANNDTTRKWMSRIFERLKSTNDTLVNHLDSLKVSVVDSSGTAEKVALLNDSAVKYFQLGLKYDSIYNKVFKDSIKSIHDAISDIGVNIGYGLGYGDTASKTIRNDLEGIKGAIDGIAGMLSGSSVDTSSGSHVLEYYNDGVALGDSIVNAYGWYNLKNVNIDSVYAAALASYNPDSVESSTNDSLNEYLARLNDSLVAQNTSLKNSLPDSLTVWAESLKVYAPFADFDSLIYSAIGAKIPNRDECPENCQKWTVNLPKIGLSSYTVDMGLCLGRAPLGNASVLSFLKLLLRIVVAWTCIFLIYKSLVGLI